MGLFDDIRSLQTIDNQWNWQILDSIEQLDKIYADSHHRVQILFKHSTTCGISAGAKYRIEQNWDDLNLDFYYLDLLAHRSVSNAVEDRTEVMHQSPQLIAIYKGQVIGKTSHHAINSGWIERMADSAKLSEDY